MRGFDEEYRQKYKLIAGIDEAGRGPLAGPVVCAAVVLPADYKNPRINDSKQLSEKVRESLYGEIISAAICYRIESVEPEEIDRINILNATKKAMSLCAAAVGCDLVLTDAVKIQCACDSVAIIKGDAKSLSIAAASILAKVTRDSLMRRFHNIYPRYNFAAHKGYATPEHIELLLRYGPCEIHRQSFIKGIYERQCSLFD